MSDIFSIKEEVQPLLNVTHYPLIIPDSDYPAMVMSPDTIRFWCELDEDFNPKVLSPISGLHHGVSYFIQDCGLQELLEWHSWRPGITEPIITEAISNGLVYHQPFYIEAECCYVTSYGQDGPDYDTETSWEILYIKPLSASVIAGRFQEWLDRPNLNQIK